MGRRTLENSIVLDNTLGQTVGELIFPSYHFKAHDNYFYLAELRVHMKNKTTHLFKYIVIICHFYGQNNKKAALNLIK